MFLFVYLAGLIGIALSQDTNLSQLPSCAQGCLSNATSHQGGCSNVDIKCLCSNFGYINVLACCLSTKCDSEDQQNAVTFNSQLCAGVNVTIPNFVGCAAGSTTSSSSKSSKSGSTSGSTKTGSFTTSPLTAEKIGSAISFPNAAPIATFTGGPLLGSSCTRPQFATVTVVGGILEYPWLGCSYENPGCCPFDIRTGGSLTICPTDYTSTSSACCPSGWSIYSSAFAGQTPCFTNPPEPLIPPSAASSATNTASISVINNKIFTLKYSLITKKQGLNSGQKAGIAVGALAGLFALVALIYLLHRRRSGKLASERALSGSTEGNFTGGKRISIPPRIHAPSQHLSELESPPFAPKTPLSEQAQWSPASTGPIVQPPQPSGPPVEMPGSTYINEHHPAYSGADGQELFHQVHGFREEDGPAISSDAASPLEGPGRR